jgi:Tol biopolymer transport system component
MSSRVIAVAILSTTLAILLAGPAAPAARQAEPDIPEEIYVELAGALSHDGRFAAVRRERNRFLYELATGRLTQLTRDAAAGRPPRFDDGQGLMLARAAAYSPDGAHIAYSWSMGVREELRVVAVRTGQVRWLIRDADVVRVDAWDWSPDSRQVLATIWRRGSPDAELVSASAVGSGVIAVTRFVDKLAGSSVMPARFSPTGRQVAFTHPAASGAGRDVSVLTMEGGQITPVLTTPDDDRLRGWLPDGRTLVFTSSREGGTHVWAAAIAPSSDGMPRAVASGIDSRDIVSIAADGTLYHVEWGSSRWRPRLAEIDFVNARVLAQPVDAAPDLPEPNLVPEQWSTDGDRLLLESVADTIETRVIAIRSLSGLRTRRLLTPAPGFRRLFWSPDERHFAVIRVAVKGTAIVSSLTAINAQTGDEEVVSDIATMFRGWSPDSRKLFFDKIVNGRGDEGVVERDIATGQERVVHTFSAGDAMRMGIALSPDASTLFFRLPASAAASSHSLIAKSVQTGRETVLARGLRILALSISPAGRYLVASTDEGLHMIAATGTSTQAIASPDGEQVELLTWARGDEAFLARTRPRSGPRYWIVNAASMRPRQIALNAGPAAMAFTASGTRVAFAERLTPARLPLRLVGTKLRSMLAKGTR